ncbi:hypothetical protein OQX63_08500 [Pedobacter sp. PF22-3]|uniref:hypothetical protein n=1 Tax=Pedobacter sp. PF22-3 TaxID=2994467 RepID=UPI0022454D1C|nr:hypothetical protein [Pedobacter sp. PF22-3]MCX2493505.1 hypothetical protein [Pedobacter sp. PF22-3]
MGAGIPIFHRDKAYSRAVYTKVPQVLLSKKQKIDFLVNTNMLPRHYHLGLPIISKTLPLAFIFLNGAKRFTPNA